MRQALRLLVYILVYCGLTAGILFGWVSFCMSDRRSVGQGIPPEFPVMVFPGVEHVTRADVVGYLHLDDYLAQQDSYTFLAPRDEGYEWQKNVHLWVRPEGTRERICSRVQRLSTARQEIEVRCVTRFADGHETITTGWYVAGAKSIRPLYFRYTASRREYFAMLMVPVALLSACILLLFRWLVRSVVSRRTRAKPV